MPDSAELGPISLTTWVVSSFTALCSEPQREFVSPWRCLLSVFSLAWPGEVLYQTPSALLEWTYQWFLWLPLAARQNIGLVELPYRSCHIYIYIYFASFNDTSLCDKVLQRLAGRKLWMSKWNDVEGSGHIRLWVTNPLLSEAAYCNHEKSVRIIYFLTGNRSRSLWVLLTTSNHSTAFFDMCLNIHGLCSFLFYFLI
jgi:hypothetical protein